MSPLLVSQLLTRRILIPLCLNHDQPTQIFPIMLLPALGGDDDQFNAPQKIGAHTWYSHA